MVKAGRVIEVDIMWAREQPGRHGKEDNCVGALEVQVFVAGRAGATG